MSQFGMQMPGSRARHSTSLDVYTVLAFVAVVFLIAGCVAMYIAAAKVGPDGNAFGMQPAKPSQSDPIKIAKPAN